MRRPASSSPRRLAPGPGPVDDGRAAADADRAGGPVVPRTLARASRRSPASRRGGANGHCRSAASWHVSCGVMPATSACRRACARASRTRRARSATRRRRRRAVRFPRRLLRERVQVSLDRDARARAGAEARAAGIPVDRPLVAFELPHRVESALPAVAFLRRTRLRGGAHRRSAWRPRRDAGRRGSGVRAAAQRPAGVLRAAVGALPGVRVHRSAARGLPDRHADADAERTRSDLAVSGPAGRRIHADARDRSRLGPRDSAARAAGGDRSS